MISLGARPDGLAASYDGSAATAAAVTSESIGRATVPCVKDGERVDRDLKHAASVRRDPAIGLIGVINRRDRGEDLAGQPIGAAADFTIACPLDPTSADIEDELDRLAAKIDAGAHVIMTQPIYSTGRWERFMDGAAARWGDRLPRRILPLHSARHAEFLDNEVPGITIPNELRTAGRVADDDASTVRLETVHESLLEMTPVVAGTWVMPSLGRCEHSAELVRRTRARLSVEAAPAASR